MGGNGRRDALESAPLGRRQDRRVTAQPQHLVSGTGIVTGMEFSHRFLARPTVVLAGRTGQHSEA